MWNVSYTTGLENMIINTFAMEECSTGPHVSDNPPFPFALEPVFG
jgi:hypothetical protein